MIALSENPVVTNPMRALTKSQREALAAIDYFKHHRRVGGTWHVGSRAISSATIDRLQSAGVIRWNIRQWTLTVAGQMAIDKLRGKPVRQGADA